MNTLSQKFLVAPSFGWLLVATIITAGCSGKTDITKDIESKPADKSSAELTSNAEDSKVAAEPPAPPTYELDAKTILSAALEESQLKDGWIRLFDGHTLFGWAMVGQADWQAKDGTISVSRGEKSFLVTNIKLSNYELLVDFRAPEETNSGVFLRTNPSPGDVELDCFELNIAPPSNPFPTGSFVGRQRVEPEQLGDFDPADWHTYLVRLEGDNISVFLDNELLYEYTDTTNTQRGHISLQHNSGKVEFRNILMRPINAQPLKLDEQWTDDWTKDEKSPDALTVTPTDAGLELSGGLGQLQSKKSYGDFLLQAAYQLDTPEVNSGIFFRCVPGALLDGYECQVNHATLNDDPLQPADSGAGAIFRRQPARIVVGDGTSPTYLTLFASGPQISTWVNGIQVTDFIDRRDADENPRRGLRLEPGPISLQGHDPKTKVTFQTIQISE